MIFGVPNGRLWNLQKQKKHRQLPRPLTETPQSWQNFPSNYSSNRQLRSLISYKDLQAVAFPQTKTVPKTVDRRLSFTNTQIQVDGARW